MPVLGLFHLIFVPKNRRWWQPVFLIGLAALIATLQLPVLLMGLNRTVSNEGLHSEAMRASDVLERLLRIMSNGLLDPTPPVGALLAVLLPLALLLAVLLPLALLLAVLLPLALLLAVLLPLALLLAVLLQAGRRHLAARLRVRRLAPPGARHQ